MPVGRPGRSVRDGFATLTLPGSYGARTGRGRSRKVRFHSPAAGTSRRTGWPARARVLPGLVLAATLTATGCASSFDAQTNQPYQPAEGVNDRSGEVYVISALVVTDDEGNGTAVAGLVNERAEPDTLRTVSATGPDGNSVSVTMPDGPVEIPGRELVQIGYEGLVRLESDTIEAGDYITLDFTFANAAPVQLEVPVVLAGSDYTDIPVGPVATPKTSS